MKRLIFIIAGLLVAFASHGQSVYELYTVREALLSAGGLGISVPGYFLSQSKRRIGLDEIRGLKREDICRFNRAAIDHYSAAVGKTSDLLLWTSVAAPLLLLADTKIRNQGGQAGFIFFETIVIASAGINLSKGLVRKPRPYVYNPGVPEAMKLNNDATNSFFSGHTAASAATAFFTAKVFSDYHPDARWQPVLWVGAAALPLATGYCRIRAGQHFLIDVLAGYCWGTLAGILIPELHRIEKASD